MMTLFKISSYLVKITALFICTVHAEIEEIHVLKLAQKANELHCRFEYDSSVILVDKALDFNRIDDLVRAGLYRNGAVTLESSGNYLKAVEYYQYSSYYAGEGSAEAAVNSGDIELIYRDINNALLWFNHAIELSGDSVLLGAHNALGLIYLGTYGDTYIDLDSALKHNKIAYGISNAAQTEEVLAETYLDRDEFADAEIHYENIVRSFPGVPDYLYNLAMTEFHQKKHEEAADHIKLAVQLDSTFNTPFAAKVLETVSEVLNKKAVTDTISD